MNKLKTILKSRTFWTLVAIVLLNTTQYYFNYLPSGATDLINTVLSSIAVYFHINPKQNFITQVETVINDLTTTDTDTNKVE
jgi:hypothetical protein